MSITKNEWRWAIGWSLALLLLSCLPYLIAIIITPEGWRFAGFLVNPQDGHSYMAKMQQGAAGNWLFHLTYTPEPHDGAYIFTFYLGLGHLARLTGLPNIIIFHLARLAAGLVLLLTAFKFIAAITPHRAERRLAFALMLTASGFGWLGALFGAFPIDLWIPEAFVHYSIYANPHFALGMALMLLIFYQVLRGQGSGVRGQGSGVREESLEFGVQGSGLGDSGQEVAESQGRKVTGLQKDTRHAIQLKTRNPKPGTLISIGLTALALAMIMPFGLLMVWAVLILFLLWRALTAGRLPWSQIWLTLSVGLFSAPVIFYQYWVSTTNPILAGWGVQNVTPAPRLLDFALGVGLLGLLAVVGGWQIIRRRENNQGEWLVLLWAATTLALVYLPFFDLQRRLISGLALPLSILAALGLTRWLAGRQLNLRRKRQITAAVVLVGLLGTLFVWILPLLGALQSPAESYTTALFFIRQDEQAAFEWLRAHAAPDDVVQASPRVGMFTPGQTGARAFYGHPFETIRAQDKQTQLEAFFAGQQPAVSPKATFIIYGPSEQALGQPDFIGYTPVYTAGQVVVYSRRNVDK